MTEKIQHLEKYVDDQDLGMRLFLAQIAQDQDSVDRIVTLMEAVNNARENGLEVELFTDSEGELGFEIFKTEPKKYGFHTLYDRDTE